MEDPLGVGLTKAQLHVLRLLLLQLRTSSGAPDKENPPGFVIIFQGAIDMALTCVDQAEAFQYSPALTAAIKSRSGGGDA